MATKKKVVSTNNEEEKVYQECTCCGKKQLMNSDHFFRSYSTIYKSTHENRMTICRNCVAEMMENYKVQFGSENRAIYELCRTLDMYYSKTVYDGAQKQILKRVDNGGNRSELYTIYISKITSLPQYRGKTFIDSEDIYDKKKDKEEIFYSVEQDILEFWGVGYCKEDYEYLENELNSLLGFYDCDSYAMQTYFQEICFTKLEIKKKRQKGASVKDEQKTLTELFQKAGINPSQESEAINESNFGAMVKKWETEEPIPEPLTAWKKKNIIHYCMVWLFGNLCNVMGKPNPYKDEWTEEMDKYTVRPPEEDDYIGS